MSETIDYAAKIAALLAKAEGTENAHEAEAFSQAAERLMLKWGIDDAMITAAANKANPTAVTEEIVTVTEDFVGCYYLAQLDLAHRMARSIGGLRTLKMGIRNGQRLYVIGHESDVERFMTLYRSLLAQSHGAMMQWWKNSTQRAYLAQQDAWRARRTFLMAFNEVVGRRLAQSKSELVAATTGSELVLIDRSQLVDNFVDGKIKPGKGRATRMGHSHHGYSEGRAAGERANLNSSKRAAVAS
jgi:hypothetical protein